jgi:peptide deformylase
MWDTMYAAGGCGLAAPQVNLPIRLFIVEDPVSGFKECFINATILGYSKDTQVAEEGCLSMPGLSVPVPRSTKIKVQYHTADWQLQQRTFKGAAARIIQHEYDHTRGVLFIDSNLSA